MIYSIVLALLLKVPRLWSEPAAQMVLDKEECWCWVLQLDSKVSFSFVLHFYSLNLEQR